MIHASGHNITDSYCALGKIYRLLWKKEKNEMYLEKAYTWKQRALPEENSAFAWCDMADFCKEILESGQARSSEQKNGLISQMAACYQKAADGQDCYNKCHACEELVGIFFGDYGTEPDIEKAIQYGEAAMKERSAYAAFRMGKHFMEQMPEEYGKIIGCLERAIDYGCQERAGGSRELLKQYLKEHEIPQYLYTEASLLAEAGSFYDLGNMYRDGGGVEKSMKAALYYYTRSMEGIAALTENYFKNWYSMAYDFMLGLQEEGVFVSAVAWEEVKSKKSVKCRTGFDRDVVRVLADLNIKYNIIDMRAFHKQTKEGRKNLSETQKVDERYE